MSSGFVSGGTADDPIARSDDWKAAQEELEANRRRKAEQERQADGRSLFDTLQANKAAKEEAFQEAAKLKNQFRSLDEDEIEFLDSVLESTRAEEARVKKETAEGLAAFRRQQDEAEKKARLDDEETAPIAEENETWAASSARKRKRTKEKDGLKGVKFRKSSTSESTLVKHSLPTSKPVDESKVLTGLDTAKKGAAPAPAPAASTKTGLALVSYGSDSEEE